MLTSAFGRFRCKSTRSSPPRSRPENDSCAVSDSELGFSGGLATPNRILSVELSIRRRSDFCNKIDTGLSSTCDAFCRFASECITDESAGSWQSVTMKTACPTTLHLLCGKIAAGKSTLARRLARRPATLLVTMDNWMSILFPTENRTIEDFAAWQLDRPGSRSRT